MSRRRTATRVALLTAALAACAAAAQGALGAFGAEAKPPAPRITSAPLRPTTSTQATFAFETAVPTAFECSLDGGSFRRCVSPSTYRRLGLGVHTFHVRARSARGAVGDATSFGWRIVAPRPSSVPAGVVPRPIMTTVPLRPWTSPSATFAWRLRDRVLRSQCSLDGRRWTACRAPTTYRGLLPGPHRFRVRAVAVGRAVSRPNAFHWTIAPGAPPEAPQLTERPQTPTTSVDAVFGFEVGAGEATECRLDDGAWIRCSPPVTYVGLTPGLHRFCVRAIGAGGLAGPRTCTTWTVVGIGGGDGSTTPPSNPTFSISGSLPDLLAPGTGGPLPLVVTNPTGAELTITDLVVTVRPGSSRAGCDGPTNLAVAQSNTAGGGVSIVVPPLGSVTLPDQGATAPVVTMRNLPTNQDACKGAVFTLAYSGTGSGS